MARVLTKCPECGQKISNRFECRNCGLLFNRYFEAQARKKEVERVRAARRSRNIFILNTTLSIFLVLCLLGGFYFWNSREEELPTPPSISAPAPTTAPAGQAATQQPAPRSTAAKTSGTPVDIAVNAVAVISSPWGQSAGFFIAEDKLLTTKKTVLYDEERLAQETDQLHQDRIWLDEEPAKIQRLKDRFEAETDAETKADLGEKITRREQRLEDRTLKYQESEKVIANLTENLKRVTIDILTSDGRTFHMAYIDTSNNYDLALVTVFSTGIAPARLADRSLEEGEDVFTLGKNGAANKATFTGYSPEGLIQTDSPIDPGNFGGPLVDKKGMVFGVSVMPPRAQRKTGLAVPVSLIRQEFGF